MINYRNSVSVIKKGGTFQLPGYPRFCKVRRSDDNIVASSKASLGFRVLKSKRHNEAATSYISTCALLASHSSSPTSLPFLAAADGSMTMVDLPPAILLVTVTFSNVLMMKFPLLFNHMVTSVALWLCSTKNGNLSRSRDNISWAVMLLVDSFVPRSSSRMRPLSRLQPRN